MASPLVSELVERGLARALPSGCPPSWWLQARPAGPGSNASPPSGGAVLLTPRPRQQLRFRGHRRDSRLPPPAPLNLEHQSVGDPGYSLNQPHPPPPARSRRPLCEPPTCTQGASRQGLHCTSACPVIRWDWTCLWGAAPLAPRPVLEETLRAAQAVASWAWPASPRAE